MPLNSIQKTFLCGETLASEDLNAIILSINNTINFVNNISTNLDEHKYDVSIPITNIYCRTKKSISATNFFPQSDALKAQLFNLVVECSTTLGIRFNVNFTTVEISNNADAMNGVWTAYPQGISEELPHEWTVSFKKLDNGDVIYMFGPVLTSNYGYNGSDGDSVQYVYKLFDRELTNEERINNTPVKPNLPNNEGEYIPSGWSDDPQGPTAEYPYEYIATLKKVGGDWGEFLKISLWSTYSEDGVNGDFQMRVFCRFAPTPLKAAPNKPIGGTYENPLPGSNDGISWTTDIPSGNGFVWTSSRTFKGNENLVTDWSTPVIESDTNELDIEYSSETEKPNVNTLRNTPGASHPSNNIWHDPSEANLDLSTMIWRAERKIKNGQYDGNWVITRIAGMKGSFKSMAFRRFTPTIQQSVPPTPSGGTYDNPVPSTVGWEDGIPSGEGPVWASVCIFTQDDTSPVPSTRWSTPQIQHDSENLDIEFSPGIGEEHTQPSNPTGEPFSNRSTLGWYDPSSSTLPNGLSWNDMVWRAERKVVNGQYDGNWVVTRIYGEQGIQGYRGNFKSRVFCRSNEDMTLSANTPFGGSYDDPIPENVDEHNVRIWLDGIPSGTGKIWTTSRTFYGDPDEAEEHSEDGWDTPSIESDSSSLDIEYCTSPLLPDARSLRSTVGGSHDSSYGVTWYDPSQINLIPQGEEIIWRAERKIDNGAYSGDWVITRILGETGPQGTRGSFKSCVFKRSSNVISGVEAADDAGVTYDNPVPTGWYDGIPSGTDVLWMAVSKFTGNGNEHTSWTVTQQTDSENLDIEFSPSETEPEPPSGNTPFADRRPSWYDSSNIPANTKMIWRAERKVHNQKYEGSWVITRIYGEKGSDAVLSAAQTSAIEKAGIEVIISPSNIILDQSNVLTSAIDDKIDDITISVVVYLNGSAMANNKYRISAASIYANGVGSALTNSNGTPYLTNNGDNLTGSKSLIINNLPITTDTSKNPNEYTYTYNKGTILGTLEVAIENNSYNIPFQIPWYLNKLGERETKIRGDVASTYMSRTAFSNPNDPVISAYTASILDGADGRMAKYGLILSKTGGGYELAFDANYILTAKENISKLNKSVTGTNLIADNGWSNTFSSTLINNKYKTACSPFVYLKVGRYIFSTYINSNTSVNNNIKLFAKLSSTKLDPSTLLTDYSNEGWQAISFNGVLEADANTGYEGEYYPSASATPKYVRIYFVFTVETSGTFQEGYYTFHVSLNNSNFTTCLRPQLEICLDSNTDQMPTAWTPGPLDFSSEIKLTADSISSTVTGINGRLTNVELTSDSITSQVTLLQKGKNLLKGTVSGSSWKSVTTPTGSIHNIEGLDSDGFITAKSGDPYLRHPDIIIKKNTYYTLSLYSKTTSSFSFLIKSPNSDFEDFSVTVPSGTSSTRRNVSFKINGTGDVTIRPIFQTTTILYPQLEIGSTATEFEASFAEIGSKITLDINKISLEVNGVTENDLQTVGIYLTGNNAGIRMLADNFRLEDTNHNLVFGKESGSNNLTFTGDIKNGTSGDGFDGAYTNEIRADGTGNLGGRWIQWDPDTTYGGLYIGPGPSSGYEEYDVMSDIAPLGDDYNGDGIRIFPNGTIHFLGNISGNFNFGKVRIDSTDGDISLRGLYINGYQTNVHASDRDIISQMDNTHIAFGLLTISSSDIILNNGQSFTTIDWGSISFGKSGDNSVPNIRGTVDNGGINGNGGDSQNNPTFGLFVKGLDGRAYKGYTGILESKYVFINGIFIGDTDFVRLHCFNTSN